MVKTCPPCGAEFTPKRSNQWSCGAKACGNKRLRTCVVCGTEWWGSSQNKGLYCTDACKATAYRVNPPNPDGPPAMPWSRRTHAKMRLRAAAQGTRGDRTLRSGWCARCGAPFTGIGPSGVYCSAACHNREKGTLNRARRAGATVWPALRRRVFERDGYVCQLCGQPTDTTSAWPHPNAPTLDHFTSLRRGGDHVEANLVTAHSRCNSHKRDLSFEEFIAFMAPRLAFAP